MQNNTISTLFIGQNFIKLSSVDSTNNFLKQCLANSEPLTEGTVIMADEQFAGRGQLNSKWLSETGKNLTFSLYLNPHFLPAMHQFYLNIAISNGINRALRDAFGINASIKWPNDIYYENKKIGGVLIENILSGHHIKHSIIGIGLNINQSIFQEELKTKASSLQLILQQRVNILQVLNEICKHIEVEYLKLRSNKLELLTTDYLAHLFRYKLSSLFRINGEEKLGTIVGINEQGNLMLNLDDKISVFGFKELEFIID